MLDDAIREHLELKKRAGASPEEVARLEHEAFGPVRREAPAPAAAEPQDDEPGAEDPAAESPSEPAVPAESPPAPPAPPADREPQQGRSWLDDDEPAAQPPDATTEFTAAEAADAEGRPGADYVAPDEEGEDLLEETPDFLQETPEHDRLWFEQRPPRDFDFDE